MEKCTTLATANFYGMRNNKVPSENSLSPGFMALTK
jgi:hypothetical protein